MKLKKLLPITAIVTTTSVVCPLVTSCNEPQQQYQLEGDLKDGAFISQKEKLPASTKSIADATKIYLDAIKNDGSIFANDYAYGLLTKFTYVETEYYTAPPIIFESLKVKINSLEEDRLSSTALPIYDLSFDIHFTGLATVDPTGGYSRYTPISSDISFNKIPFRCIRADASESGYTPDNDFYFAPCSYGYDNTTNEGYADSDFNKGSITMTGSDKSTTTTEVYNYDIYVGIEAEDGYMCYTAINLSAITAGYKPYYMEDINVTRA